MMIFIGRSPWKKGQFPKNKLRPSSLLMEAGRGVQVAQLSPSVNRHATEAPESASALKFVIRGGYQNIRFLVIGNTSLKEILLLFNVHHLGYPWQRIGNRRI